MIAADIELTQSTDSSADMWFLTPHLLAGHHAWPPSLPIFVASMSCLRHVNGVNASGAHPREVQPRIFFKQSHCQLSRPQRAGRSATDSFTIPQLASG